MLIDTRLDYFYPNEAEQFSFYRIPKSLFTDSRFRNLSAEAKILYGLMLDRMGLSVKNGWIDQNGHVFIYFTMENAMEYLGCGHGKAVRLFAELDTKSGAGLIERRKVGQGHPTKIFVKNFVTKPEPHTSENGKSAFPENGSADFPKTDRSNTYVSDTERNDTDPSINPANRKSEADPMDAMETYREVIRENISYDVLKQKCDPERLDEIVDIMLDTLCSRKRTIRIAGEDSPAEAVKSRLLKLNDGHIEYVLECLDKNTTDIRNIRSYILTALYQAPSTINNYYAACVNHNLYGKTG